MVQFFDTEDVLKASTYNESDNTITWRIYLNHQGDMSGDATVEDYLPEGLKFVKAEVSYDISTGNSDFGSNFVTTNKNTSNGNIKENGVSTEVQADGTTKVTVELENLKGFTFNTVTENEDGTTSVTTDTDKVFNSNWWDSKNWVPDGNIVLIITTEITDEAMLKGIDSYKNTVKVYNDTMAYGTRTAFATQTVPLTSLEENLDKSMDTYAGGTTLTFQMEINPDGEDLVRGSDTLEIMDVMGDKMSLATKKKGYFVVTNKDTGDQLTMASSADNIGANQFYVTQVPVPTNTDAEGDSTTAAGTAYKIIVPDGMKLHIKYLVTVDAAVGDTVSISNKAYFNYDGLRGGSDASNYQTSAEIFKMTGSSHASGDPPEFQIFKEDQYGNPVKGVTFQVYQVTLTSDGKEALVGEATTDEDGYATFASALGMNDKAVFYFVEKDAPTGYAMSTDKTYFYFTKQDDLQYETAIGIDYWEKIFEVTNEFTPAKLEVPLTKTINGESQKNNNTFGFTLTQTNGADVYSDAGCTTKTTTAKASIQGSGNTTVDTVYFAATGEYTFELTEDALTENAANEGFAKDDTVYFITVNVASGDQGYYVASAQYSWTDAEGTAHTGNLSTDKPVFDNKLTLDPITVTLDASKVLDGEPRPSGIQAGEFKFNVVEYGEVIATGTTQAEVNGKASIVFTDMDGNEGITFDQDDLGPHYLTIYEVQGDDLTITYSTVKFLATVVVEPIEGQKQLQATVTYSTRYATDLEDGKPLFTNTYTPISPTGIPTEFVPFAVMAVAAVSVGAVLTVRRWKRRIARS
jgi:pilin isopeptide linkage protein